MLVLKLPHRHAAIRTAFEESGELSAALELGRLFPGISDNVRARASPDDRRVDATVGVSCH